MTAGVLPPKELFWGLTVKDFENSLWNFVYEAPTFFAGLGVAAATNVLGQLAFNKKEKGKEASIGRAAAITTLSIIAGVGASAYVGSSVAHVQFTAEKAFKFLILSCIPPLTAFTYGGVAGYFGRTCLYLVGGTGAIGGGVASAFILKGLDLI
ncbi:MAG: hypothetical protein JSS10_00665 [Verrucomicrobia bacterium]|nr:hypothetical protein [Verrucomicrobiota bacterium]